MPRIVEIAGVRSTRAVPTQADISSELNERSRLVKPAAFVDTTAMSEGEMRLFLLAQRDKTLAEFYPDVPEYRQAFEAKRDALYKGLHTLGIDYAGLRLKSQPASGWMTWEEKQRSPKAGFNLLFEEGQVAGIGEIPQINCDGLYPELTVAILQSQNIPSNLHMQLITERNSLRERCKVENLWRKGLNDFWPASGTTLLYEFLTGSMIPGNLSGQSVIDLGGKAQRHREFVNAVNYGSKISFANLRLWLENGVMASSIKGAQGQSLGPQLPIDYINAFKEDGQDKIGVIWSVVISVAVGVLALNWNGFKNLVGVIKGDQRLKDSIKNQTGEIGAFLNKYASEIANLAGLGDWIPEGVDNGNNTPPPTQGGGMGTGLNNNLLLLGGAALVGVALLSKK